ncbi:C-3 sterol dehydrogenase/C-4 decarboxylase-like protein [Glonium stellatum]|uniref:C-3 sterol dehydrogenase/C-4 decarboxylase-like protein n=1 Tax=Glonium stellatum TaxID=574774 RepID=A0A8E2JXJ2_9PEZI|nr:C-3 sterol dehydrogenase/C-4 decarboxylase-like protein [Glonium stellatum]
MECHKVLVTGGTGFLASAIVQALIEQKQQYAITVLDIKPPSSDAPSHANVNYVQADVLNFEDILKVFKEAKPSIVVHTVGVSPAGNARYSQNGKTALFEINVNGTKNALDASRQTGVQAFIYTSSCAVVTDDVDHDYPNYDETTPTGNSTLIYGQSKTTAETLVISANSPTLRTCALRPSIIFGPGDVQGIPTIHACMAKGETPFIIGSGTNLFDFVYVTNVADAHVLAISNLLTSSSAAGQVFCISNDVPSFEVRIPKRLAWILGFAAEYVTWVMGTQATLSRGSVKDACGVRYANLGKARRVLGYQPRIGLAKGVKIACQHYKTQLRR